MRTDRIKMGGEKRISVFLKGNHDLTDSLLAVGEGGQRLERGLRQRVREAYRGTFEIEIIHEPAGPSEFLLESLSPPSPERRDSEPRPLAGESATRLFQQAADVMVFSLEPDITRPLWSGAEAASVAAPLDGGAGRQRPGSAERCRPVGSVSVERFRDHFIRLVGEIKKRLGCHIIVFNCSSFDPDDHTRNYHGLEDTLALRAHRLNLALMDISTEEGISIVDTDRILAEMGGGRHVVRPFRYSTEACEAICEEFIRILQDIGFFERRPLVKQVGRAGG